MIYDKNAVYLWEINFMTYMYLYCYSIDVIASSSPKTSFNYLRLYFMKQSLIVRKQLKSC